MLQIIQEMKSYVIKEEAKSSCQPSLNSNELEDLWSPKKISSFCEANICGQYSSIKKNILRTDF